MTKRTVKSLSVVAIAISLAMGGIGFDSTPFIRNVYADEVIQSNTLSVNGEATIKAKPNVGYVSVGVQTENKQSKIAQQDNAKKMTEVYKALEKLKIPKELIRTENYSVYPVEVYSEKDKRSYVSTYRVINTVKITVNDIDIVGEVIDAAALNGANQINNVIFGLKDADEYYLQALKEASKKAKRKAEMISEIFGIKLTVPSQINENVNYQPVYYRDSQAVSVVKGEGQYATPVSYGELEIKANVYLVYKY